MGAVPENTSRVTGDRPSWGHLCSFDAVQQFLTHADAPEVLKKLIGYSSRQRKKRDPQNHKGTWKWESYPHVHVPVFQLLLASRGVESNISINDVYCILYLYKSESIYDSYRTHWNIRRPQSYLVFSTSLEVRFCNALCNPSKITVYKYRTLKYLQNWRKNETTQNWNPSTNPLIPASLLESWILNPSTIQSSNDPTRVPEPRLSDLADWSCTPMSLHSQKLTGGLPKKKDET